jgi:peptidoglycan hydrolase-like protein with peptidoglycan-binding domain
MQGTLNGTDSHFHNPSTEVSSHFGVGKDGRIYQWVDTDDVAWAEMAGNSSWISVECEGQPGDSLTDTQLSAVAQVVKWAQAIEGFPLQITDSPAVPGLGWHGMGGEAWGNHPDCPGDPIKAQRRAILGSNGTNWPQGLVAALPTLQVGASGQAVRNLQALLLVHGSDPHGIDGNFGPGTDAAVRAFQQGSGLGVDGAVGQETWTSLLGTLPTLQLGASGQAASNLQALLLVHGSDPHGIDGNFGPGTDAAVRAFQQGSGLGVDGIVGRETWTALLNR